MQFQTLPLFGLRGTIARCFLNGRRMQLRNRTERSVHGSSRGDCDTTSDLLPPSVIMSGRDLECAKFPSVAIKTRGKVPRSHPLCGFAIVQRKSYGPDTCCILTAGSDPIRAVQIQTVFGIFQIDLWKRPQLTSRWSEPASFLVGQIVVL
ncbi:hypothetical protein BDY19DRAFT_280051 [Irpex rosettiformis]|uniref:Uncharacterized protein n=1 Tax=Irpex rosettiformis TaxID=378272 RepID=A0ACB8UHU8_9APHY|nr:hypothetical protein BDY19DRAFT_280051 [Irpex rosettiformis]